MSTYTCRRCGYVADSKTYLKQHYNRVYPCKNIHKAPDKDICIKELYASYTYPALTCRRCGYVADTKYYLKKHYNRKFPCENKYNAPDKDTCIKELCSITPTGISFSDESIIPNTATCQFCNYTFSNPSNLKRHLSLCKYKKQLDTKENILSKLSKIEERLTKLESYVLD